jgi:phosphoribosylformimino-5-aminoimidazole carboxamide ribotide isomerase
VKKIVETVDVPIEFGGGIRSIDDVQQLCDVGVSRIVLGTVAVESPDLLRKLVARFPERICVGIDARNGVATTHGWETETQIEALSLARSVVNCGIQRIIYTDVARDGMLTGPNIEQTVALARAANVHVTASGGVSSLDDVKRLRDAGEPLLDSVIVGKALYEQKFKLEDAINL